jgi:hypothetical protein
MEAWIQRWMNPDVIEIILRILSSLAEKVEELGIFKNMMAKLALLLHKDMR